MRLQQLMTEIEAAQWFTNLGNAAADPFVVPIGDLTSWRRFVSASTAAEFGLAHEPAADVAPVFPAPSYSL